MQFPGRYGKIGGEKSTNEMRWVHDHNDEFPGADRAAREKAGGAIKSRRCDCLLRRSRRGKTAFTRGLAAGLGVTECVTSPTYTIVNEYLSGRMPLFHFDMYRLSSSEELFDIGWEDYLARGGVCAVEWSENVEDALEGAIAVTIEKRPRAAGPAQHYDRRRRTL